MAIVDGVYGRDLIEQLWGSAQTPNIMATTPQLALGPGGGGGALVPIRRPVPTGNLPVPTGNLPVLANQAMGAIGYPQARVLGPGSAFSPGGGGGSNIPTGTFRRGANPNPIRALGPDLRPTYGPNIPAELAAQAEASGIRGLASQAAGRQVLPNITGLKRGLLGLGVGVGADVLSKKVDPEGGILGRTISGAGTGAGLGLMSKNPLVIGGAAVAGGVAGALGLLGGGKGKSGSIDWDKVDALGIPADEREQYRALYELEKDALGEETARANLMQRLNGSVANIELSAQQAAAEQQAQARMLASQALAGQFFAPFANDMIQSAQMRHQAIQNLLPSLPANYRGVAQANSAASLDNAIGMARAYQAQSQMMPALAAFQDQQQQINSVAAQLMQQGMQNAIGGGQAAGGASMADILASQAMG